MSEPFTRVALVLHTVEQPSVRETYGFTGGHGVVLEGQLLRPIESATARTVFVFMHPSSTLNLLPMPVALAARGRHVLCANARYPKNDTALIMEKVLLDLASWLRWAREQAGYQRVVLVGWSGGGSLSLLYQAEAEDPRITHTPAGDPVDVVSARLPAADGIVFIAAHLSRAETLTEWMDPSVHDETDPDVRDPEFDIYAADTRHRPPYRPEFVAAFRAAQRARNRRISAWARAELQRLADADGPEQERPFLVHRTMCDVRWLDPTIDPNDRAPGVCYLGDPRTANVGPVGLARYTTLRSWLSQWSYEHSAAAGARNAARIRAVPVLQIENSADDAVPATHNRIVRDALAATDKSYHLIRGATHYYVGQPELLAECIDTVEAWARERDLA
ncbi:alpha/beta hydrolase family protein [Skermania piniformis]|uniref:Alpha/beta fold hydrolase n=1 Tax=Skermania pinensis TaxID=39122 RepID=A0ABX8S7Y0_9ACTN|nr:alpha/beta fold hydrolase [Skermania piniformis]QXQ12665.1 alpha/beta fold hydrolase [Skermania piniformis]